MSGIEYSQGICADGAAILKDGAMMTVDEVVQELRTLRESLTSEKWHLDIAEGALASLRLRHAGLQRRDVCEIANRICRDIPEEFHIELTLENGAGWVSLFHKGKPVDIDMADWNIAQQFDVAMQCVKEIAQEQGS